MTVRKIPDVIKEVARKLRKDLTEVEVILWDKLRDRKLNWIKFLRQYPIYVYTEYFWLDRYIIPDFVCKSKKIVIELDWWIHDLKDVYLLDREKEKLLINNWYKVLRFKNQMVKNNLDLVINEIVALLS